MCVSICVCICVFVYVCLYVYMSVFIHVFCICMFLFVCMCLYIHNVCVYICLFVYMHVCVCVSCLNNKYYGTFSIDIAALINNTSFHLLANSAPTITGPKIINAVIGQPATLIFNATDDQTDPPSFVLVQQPATGFTFDNSTGTAVWSPSDTTPVAIRFVIIIIFFKRRVIFIQ